MVLMEVVMALFIFTVVAFALVKALDSAFDATRQRNEVDAAVRGLANQLALVHAQRVIPSENDAPSDNSGITYHISITQEQLKDQKGNMVPNTYRVVITAHWTSLNQDQERDVSELIYQP
jgi:hypothetical protein